MVDVVNTSVTRIYENQSLTVTARIDKSDVESIEEVTFKFLKDGTQFEEKAIPIKSASTSATESASGGDDKGGAASTAEGSSDAVEKSDDSGDSKSGDTASSTSEQSGGDESKTDSVEETAEHAVVSHTVKAPAVDDDKGFYFLDYHYFYKVKSTDGKSETLQNFPASRIQVFPRFAQLKVNDKDGKAFKDFRFYIEQDGKRGEVNKTFAGDTVNAKGKTIPAGSSEFNLGLFPGFRVVPCPPFRVTEEVVTTGRKREVKGMVGFRAKFVAPVRRPRILQYVDYAVENNGQGGLGHEVLVEVGPHPEDVDSLNSIAKPTVHFRVTYGPPADEAVAKSVRDDKDHPTKVSKPSASDKSVTVEEKEAKKKYQGKVELVEGAGKFLVGLGKAGGDTCMVEISGAADFLTDASIYPDETIVFENWRRVHYELMVPDLLKDRLDESFLGFGGDAQKRLDKLGRDLFIEFLHDGTQVFNTVMNADYGTLFPRSFLEMPDEEKDVAYVLSGRNWRKPPNGQAWAERHPGKSLYISFCDRLYKWRQDTDDEKAGTKDFSGTLTEAVGSINVEEKFEGRFMPFSGHDSGDGLSGIHWTADISKDDAVCKRKPALKLREVRYAAAISTGLTIALSPAAAIPEHAKQIVFKRLPYPKLELADKTAPADKDDGKLTIKDPVLGKELVLEFDVPQPKEESGEAKQEENENVESGTSNSSAGFILVPNEDATENAAEGEENAAKESFSDWGEIPDVAEGERPGPADAIAVVTADHEAKIDAFFQKLFKDGKAQLAAKEESNKFSLEILGGNGADHRGARVAQVSRAIRESYSRTFSHDQHDFKSTLSNAETTPIQEFVKGLLEDQAALAAVNAGVAVEVSCPQDAKHEVDACLKAVVDKLKELFDANAKEFAVHPGLDPANGFASREGDLTLAEITNVPKSSTKLWSFSLPNALQDGTPGPGSFVGTEKTAERCPVKFELSFQPHVESPGEADGRLLAWVCGQNDAPKVLAALVLRSFLGTEDKAGLEHGHGKDGAPGDCLFEGDDLCEKCLAFGRSRNLTSI